MPSDQCNIANMQYCMLLSSLFKSLPSGKGSDLQNSDDFLINGKCVSLQIQKASVLYNTVI